MIFQDYDINYGCPLPLRETLVANAIRVTERKAYRRPVRYVINPNTGERFQHVRHNRLGDPYATYRLVHIHRGRYSGAVLREIRAAKGVGRPV